MYSDLHDYTLPHQKRTFYSYCQVVSHYRILAVKKTSMLESNYKTMCRICKNINHGFFSWGFVSNIDFRGFIHIIER